MPAKRKKTHDPKLAADPLGKKSYFFTLVIKDLMFFCFR
jgi:hypothetical protein